MGKLGKKARKFAKKNLQSVLKRRRKLKSIIKRKHSSRDKRDAGEDQVGESTVLSNGRKSDHDAFENTHLDAIFLEDDNDSVEDDSDSDGFLSEDSTCPYVAESESESERDSKGQDCHRDLLGQNMEIRLQLAKQKRKLDRLREMDPEFSKFLESLHKGPKQLISEETCSDEEGQTSNRDILAVNEGVSSLKEGKVLMNSTIDYWCQLVMENHSVSVLPNLLNGYRTACQYGIAAFSCNGIQKSETFCKILMFMLREADGIFQRLLGISSSNCKRETISELKNGSKWKNAEPLIKSYLRSTLLLLNQVTDCEILTFALERLKASIIFFAAFPSLLRRILEAVVHLWATGRGTLSSSSFVIIHDLALLSNSEYFNTCLIKTYRAFIAHCKFVEPTNVEHIQFLRDSLVELCSLDVRKSFSKAMVSVQQLAKILQHGLRMKKKEALKRIYNWQYANCLDLLVKFISTNVKDHDLQSLLYLIIQVISGVAHLFSGPRYLPLRLKCIQMLNQLSSSSGVFIPVSSLVLDSLEHTGSPKGDARPENAFNFSSIIKVPKQWLKSQDFQKECVLSMIELLSSHFAQWSYHVSFPELATVPLIRLRKFHEKTTAESLRNVVKRFIDQVEQNVEFVRKKRDEVSFSPKDLEFVESFLQLEKSSRKTPFTQYYASIMQKSISRNLVMKQKISALEQKASRKQNLKCEDVVVVNVDGETDLNKEKVISIINGGMNERKRKKQRV